jgi:hypothetical protein
MCACIYSRYIIACVKCRHYWQSPNRTFRHLPQIKLQRGVRQKISSLLTFSQGAVQLQHSLFAHAHMSNGARVKDLRSLFIAKTQTHSRLHSN